MSDTASETHVSTLLTKENSSITRNHGCRRAVTRKVPILQAIHHGLGLNPPQMKERYKLRKSIHYHRNGNVPLLRTSERAHKIDKQPPIGREQGLPACITTRASCAGLARLERSHLRTYSKISVRMRGHQKLVAIFRNFFRSPKCPDSDESWKYRSNIGLNDAGITHLCLLAFG
jgi:hypothetical protein